MKTETHAIPTWALCYLVNGDLDGLEPGEKRDGRRIDGTQRYPGCMANRWRRTVFTSYPPFGLACDVQECECVIEWQNKNKMNPHDYIEYGGKEYPLFFLDMPDEDGDIMEVAVATEPLARALLDKNGIPLNHEAERIDDDIFFYISEDAAGWDEQDIIDHIIKNL